MPRFLLLLVGAMLAARPAVGLYTYITESAPPRCFIEEVPADTLIVGSYKNPDFVTWGSPGFTGSGIKYTLQDPSGAIVQTETCDNVVRERPRGRERRKATV